MRMNCSLRICPVCGGEFHPCVGKRAYCSLACVDRASAARAVARNRQHALDLERIRALKDQVSTLRQQLDALGVKRVVIITTEAEYEAALLSAALLMDAEPGTAEERELTVLVHAIHEYEKRFGLDGEAVLYKRLCDRCGTWFMAKSEDIDVCSICAG